MRLIYYPDRTYANGGYTYFDRPQLEPGSVATDYILTTEAAFIPTDYDWQGTRVLYGQSRSNLVGCSNIDAGWGPMPAQLNRLERWRLMARQQQAKCLPRRQKQDTGGIFQPFRLAEIYCTSAYFQLVTAGVTDSIINIGNGKETCTAFFDLVSMKFTSFDSGGVTAYGATPLANGWVRIWLAGSLADTTLITVLYAANSTMSFNDV